MHRGTPAPSLPPRLSEVLIYIADRLEDTEILWAVTGSLGLALRGIPVRVRDVDLQTDEAGAYAMQARLEGPSLGEVRFHEAERIRSHFGVLEILGVRVEIMGDIQHRMEDGSWDSPLDLAARRELVTHEGRCVPVLPLEEEHRAYALLGRHRTARILARAMRSTR